MDTTPGDTPSKDAESDDLRLQNEGAIPSMSRVNPWVYTLEGCNMAATVLNTPKAIKRSVTIMRTFSDLERMAHGERRTNMERKAVTEMLEDEEWGTLPDNEIARVCKVTHPFVGKLRKELSCNGYKIENRTVTPSEKRTYQTKHGTISTMHSLPSLLACALP